MHCKQPYIPIGRAILQIRRHKNLSQRIVAERCGMERQHISRVENEHCQPGVDVLCAIARGLQVKPGTILNHAARLAHLNSVFDTKPRREYGALMRPLFAPGCTCDPKGSPSECPLHPLPDEARAILRPDYRYQPGERQAHPVSEHVLEVDMPGGAFSDGSKYRVLTGGRGGSGKTFKQFVELSRMADEQDELMEDLRMHFLRGLWHVHEYDSDVQAPKDIFVDGVYCGFVMRCACGHPRIFTRKE